MGGKDLKEHGSDIGKQIVSVGAVFAVFVTIFNWADCAKPWQTPAKAKTQHTEITTKAVEREGKIGASAKVERDRIEKALEIQRGEIKQDINNMGKKIDRLYLWGREDRRGR